MMFGPLGKPPKVRVAPERVARPVADNSRVEVAEEVVQDEEDEEDGEAVNEKEFNEATFARIDHQEKVLREFRDKGEDAELISFLVDPLDQVQTVENFDYAFLIKEKFTSEKIDKTTGLPVIKPTHRELLAEKENKQLVLSLNMQELKELALMREQGEVRGEVGVSSDEENINSSGNSSSRSKCGLRNGDRLSLHRDDKLYKARRARADHHNPANGI